MKNLKLNNLILKYLQDVFVDRGEFQEWILENLGDFEGEFEDLNYYKDSEIIEFFSESSIKITLDNQ